MLSYAHDIAFVWRAEKKFAELILSLHSMGSGARTQAVRHGDKHLRSHSYMALVIAAL